MPIASDISFDAESYDVPDPSNPDIERFYGNLRNYVRMVVDGYSNMLMLDAKGGLGKTHNVKEELREHLDSANIYHQKGFTTPLELYKTLWVARREDSVLFLDDMSGITSNTKAIDMLKSATDTEGEENWVEYHTSRDIDHPAVEGGTLPNTFSFNGSIIMSFNETPDNRHFNALKDRGTFYQLRFSYEERLALIREVAKLDEFSQLPVRKQQTTAEWIADVTDPTFDVTIRTFEEVCRMRAFAEDTGQNWEKMALDVFEMDYQKYLIRRLRKTDLSVKEQIEIYKDETGYSQGHYYDTLSDLKDQLS